MKANPGYKWCPTTNKPVKSSSQTVGSARKKSWSFPTNSTKDPPAAKKVPKTDNKPQLNFAMAGLYLSSLFKHVCFSVIQCVVLCDVLLISPCVHRSY